MAREDLHFRLRIPEALKRQVAEAAEKRGHSMTAEINERLARTFNDPMYDIITEESDAFATAVRTGPSEEQQIEDALFLERGMYEEALIWLEDHPDDQSAKDAVEISEMRLTQLERRLEKIRAASDDQ
ncbi:Arc family DNA-binding protein [Gluconobacter cerevisiae]|uniref:Arc family DNA-binding protein n=2 Tax=Gluconobacter cerevisiae TaxID=1379734 RepID=A0ABR9YF23_9PROT|nr:Arc family DNA-binding protein [Gluconobacter cerevisiae]